MKTRITEARGMTKRTSGNMGVGCRNPPVERQHYESKPSTSSTSYRGRSYSPKHIESSYERRTASADPHVAKQIRELGASVARVRDYIEQDRVKKATKEQKKKEKEQEKRRLEDECMARERQEMKKVDKEKKAVERAKQEALKDAELREEMRKVVNMQVHMQLGQVNEALQEGLQLTAEQAKTLRRKKGKEEVTYQSEDKETSDEESCSEEEELSRKTTRLRISEKRKRADEHAFEDNPPMELPPKRIPARGILKPLKLSTKLARSKRRESGAAKGIKLASTRTPSKTKKTLVRMKTPSSAKKTPQAGKVDKTPGQNRGLDKSVSFGSTEKLKRKNAIMLSLRGLDAPTSQGICKKEGIPYTGKIDAIFDIRILMDTEEVETRREDDDQTDVVT
ncbi:hypothetical protein CBR_g37393 [Chara braunii]|uniref:Uncharacterized protein n=1 Tax=Chara braunii TaxID=69332 RepID=A0A388JZV2_CHABU|nr:hypothetical protein CBR_g37393 [Chara braunii]|eukprot:GBG63307.1 hypothetical protein CBR_g37393 [Chara braunii]